MTYAYVGKQVPRLIAKGSKIIQLMGSYHATYNGCSDLYFSYMRGSTFGTRSRYAISFIILCQMVGGVSAIRGHCVLYLFGYIHGGQLCIFAISF